MRTLTDADVEAIAAALALRLQSSAPPLPRIGVTIDEVQVMLGLNSQRTTQRHLEVLDVKPYISGHYRLKDLENAIARRTRA